MKRRDADEAAALLQRALAALLAVPGDMSTTAAATLRRDADGLGAEAGMRVRAGNLGQRLASCFETARAAGGTFDGFEAVRAAIMLEEPQGQPAVAVHAACLRLVLAQQALVISDGTFTSREDVDRILARVNAAFEASIDFAADNSDGLTYQSLIILHAAVVRDLQDRSRPLPRMVAYGFGRSFPALVLANRLYGDAGRSDELIDENKSLHPLFMSQSIRALSA
jgi:prophage DNA circulation protein